MEIWELGNVDGREHRVSATSNLIVGWALSALHRYVPHLVPSLLHCVGAEIKMPPAVHIQLHGKIGYSMVMVKGVGQLPNGCRSRQSNWQIIDLYSQREQRTRVTARLPVCPGRDRSSLSLCVSRCRRLIAFWIHPSHACLHDRPLQEHHVGYAQARGSCLEVALLLPIPLCWTAYRAAIGQVPCHTEGELGRAGVCSGGTGNTM